MKAMKVLLLVIFALVLLGGLAFAGGGEIYTRNGSDVNVWKIAESYSNVPKEIPNEIAVKMARGESCNYTVSAGRKIQLIKSFPPLQVKEFKNIWIYREGEFKLLETASEIKTGWRVVWVPMTILFFLPLALCSIVSLLNQRGRYGARRLTLVYLCLVGSVLLGTHTNLCIGVFVAALIVTFSSWFAGGLFAIPPGIFLGFVVGAVSVGPILSSDEKIFFYMPFVTGVCLVSFTVAKLFGIRK